MRESIPDKASRYLAEGRLLVTAVSGDHITALCRGNGAIYDVGHSPDGGWQCSCPALADCCHRDALRRVTVRQRSAEANPWQRSASADRADQEEP